MLAGRRWDSWIAGNFLIIKKRDADVYALLALLKTGSIAVGDGQPLSAGQQLAAVGHSGHSSEPHLHFQLMDDADLATARGVPCNFFEYEELRDGLWHKVQGCVPHLSHPIRSAA